MSDESVSRIRNRFNINHILYDVHSRNSNVTSKSESLISDTKAIKSSNCVINIDYLVQEEKISFEVFRSMMDPNYVYKKNISLRQSKSCTHLNSYEKIQTGNFKLSKTIQTEKYESLLSPHNLGPVPFNRTCLKKQTFEQPVKDTTNNVTYKENYGVSSFKFPEQPNTNIKPTAANFCSLDYDGTRSTKKNFSLHRTKNRPAINVKRVQSDTNVKQENAEKHNQVVTTNMICQIPNSSDKTISDFQEQCNVKTKRKIQKIIEDVSDKTIKLKKQDRAAFELFLTPKDELVNKSKQDKKMSQEHHKPRNIIVTSNTLHPINKTTLKNAQQQTQEKDFRKLLNSSINELYLKPNFYTLSTSYDSGDQVPYKKKKKRKKRQLTMTVFPCLEIRNYPEDLEGLPVLRKRPTIPRRTIPQGIPSNEISETTNEKIASDDGDLYSLKKTIPRKAVVKENSIESSSDISDDTKLKEQVTNLLLSSSDAVSQNLNYCKKIEYLCNVITSIVKENPSSTVLETSTETKPKTLPDISPESLLEFPSKTISEIPPEIISKHTTETFVQEEAKPIEKDKKFSEKNKLERLQVNKIQNVSIDGKQQLVPRNVLQVSPRAVELFKNSQFMRKKSIATYPISIMPDPIKMLQPSKTTCVTYTPTTTTTTTTMDDAQIINYKLSQANTEPKENTKKSQDLKKSFTSVTFSSQVGILGSDNNYVNLNEDVSVKNTLFPIFENICRKPKPFPNKCDLSKKSDISPNSTFDSSAAGGEFASSRSNSDLFSIPEDKLPKKKHPIEKAKLSKVILANTSTFLSAKRTPIMNNSFQKRKDYYMNLKLKMKNKPELADTDKKNDFNSSDVTDVALTSSNVKLMDDKNNEKKISRSSKSKIPLRQIKDNKSTSTKEFLLKAKKESTLFPYEISLQPKEEILYKDTKQSRPVSSNSNEISKSVSPHKVDVVKKQISTFLQSYPLDISSKTYSMKTEDKPKISATVSETIDTGFNFSQKSNARSAFTATTMSKEGTECGRKKIKTKNHHSGTYSKLPIFRDRHYSKDIKFIYFSNRVTKSTVTRRSNKRSRKKKSRSRKSSSATTSLFNSPEKFAKMGVSNLSLMVHKSVSSSVQKSIKSKSSEQKQISSTKPVEEISEYSSSIQCYSAITDQCYMPREEPIMYHEVEKTNCHSYLKHLRSRKHSSKFTCPAVIEEGPIIPPKISENIIVYKNTTETSNVRSTSFSKQTNQNHNAQSYPTDSNRRRPQQMQEESLACRQVGRMCGYFFCQNSPKANVDSSEFHPQVEKIAKEERQAAVIKTASKKLNVSDKKKNKISLDASASNYSKETTDTYKKQKKECYTHKQESQKHRDLGKYKNVLPPKEKSSEFTTFRNIESLMPNTSKQSDSVPNASVKNFLLFRFLTTVAPKEKPKVFIENVSTFDTKQIIEKGHKKATKTTRTSDDFEVFNSSSLLPKRMKNGNTDRGSKKKNKNKTMSVPLIIDNSITNFSSKYSEFGLVSERSEILTNNKTNSSEEKKSTAKLFKMFRIDSMTNYIKRKKSALKKIVTNRKK